MRRAALLGISRAGTYKDLECVVEFVSHVHVCVVRVLFFWHLAQGECPRKEIGDGGFGRQRGKLACRTAAAWVASSMLNRPRR